MSFPIIFALLIAVVILIVVFAQKKQRHIRFVKENSISLLNLALLNKKYSFYTSTANFDMSHTYDNEKFYDSISCEDYLIYQLQYKKYEIMKEIKLIRQNSALLERYLKEVGEIMRFGEYKEPTDKLNLDTLQKIERELFNKLILKPTTDFNVCVMLKRSDINGKIFSRKHDYFSINEIVSLVNRLNDQNHGFYNDRGIWDALCRVERGKVSNKMRFSIYKRDGYRCKFCGRTERVTSLEIDHIKPIAKGGKSEYSNLQTLCVRCNKEKGDTYLEK